MASYYLKWGEERLEDKYYKDAQKQSIDVQKDILGDDGIDAIADKTTTLKAMNPFESDDLPIASATMNITNQQYYNLWTQTKPQQYSYSNGETSPTVEFSKKFFARIKDAVNNTKEIQRQTQLNLFVVYLH